jgi:acylphosphatase
MEEVRLKIYGHVQGVFFRAATQKQAQELALKGFVKNYPDGSVFVVAQGEREQLQQLKKWCTIGPAPARVERVEEIWSVPTQQYPSFEIR